MFFSWSGSKSIDAIDHVGMVIKDNHDGTIQTVEGNTNGGEVAARTRDTSTVVGYGYPAYAGSFVSLNEFTSARAAKVLLGPGYFREGKAVIDGAMATVRTHGLYVIVNASSAATAIAAMRALGR